MDPSEFTTDAAGWVRRATSDYWCFVPRPLPPSLTYTPELTLLLSQADAALSELSGLGRFLPNPDLLIAPYVKREAVASTRIEGTQADLSDLLIDEIEPSRTPAGSDVYEIRNYVAALNRGLRSLVKLPLGVRLIREMHGVLMKGVRGQERTPGELRRTQNWIGPPGSTIATATYVPPPPNPEMLDCLMQWERFIHQRDSMPELVQCALIHEHFEAIHPFLDGNGRIGRLLITLFLVERGRLSKPLLYLSSYVERNRSQYYELLQRIRTHGDWDAWLRYFLTAVRVTARHAVEQSRSLVELRDKTRVKLASQYRALALLDELFLNPYVTIPRAAKVLGVSTPTAAKTVQQLVKIGMLRETTGREWSRVWLSKPILKITGSQPGD